MSRREDADLTGEEIGLLISRNVIELLEKQNMTLRAIGDAIGVSRSYISHVKRGRRGLTMGRLIMLAEYLGQTLPELLLEITKEKSVSPELRPQYKRLRKILGEARSGR